MGITWDINEKDISKILDFISKHNTSFVEERINRNIHHIGITIDKDTIIKNMLICLLTTQQKSSPGSTIDVFFRTEPFAVTYKLLSSDVHVEDNLREILKNSGLTRFLNKIPIYFSTNYEYLMDNNWSLLTLLENCTKRELSKIEERELADSLDHSFKGFGSKQARNFLQMLGISRYEIPIDSRTIKWLKGFGFPILFSPVALQDKAFYHFISDGIQLLCEKADIYPCVLDAAIFSSKDAL